MRTRQSRRQEGATQGQLEERTWLEVKRRFQLRRVIFWLHLLTGVVTGLIIGIMSLTGVLLAFERQIVDSAEHHIRTVQPPASGAVRLDIDAIVAKARAAVPAGQPSSVTLRAAPTEAVLLNFGRDQTVFVDPYSGAVRSASTWRSFFRVITDWHRWLGTSEDNRNLGRAITGACNAAFAILALTGIYLWWPRHWARQALKAIMVPAFSLRGRPRNWNWHNVTGFWSTAILLCITLTGVVMSYQWANDLIYTMTGNTPPPRPAARQPAAAGNRTAPMLPMAGTAPGERQGRSGEAAAPPHRASLQALFIAATQQAPHWRSLSMRLPQRGAAQMTIMIEEATSLHPYPRSILTLDVATAAVVQWEPYGSNPGRMLRSWVRPVHTGEAGGLIGQSIAALASAGDVVLVWTGSALAWRRFFRRKAQAHVHQNVC